MKYRVVVVVLLATQIAWADPIPPIPPGDDKIVPVKEGDKAPFTGQLFDQSTALRWGNWLQQYKLRLSQDVDREKKTCEVQVKYKDEVLRIEEKRAATITEDLRNRLQKTEEARLRAEEEARNPSWYTTRTFGVIVGAVGTAAIFGFSVYAIDSLRK